MIWVVGVNGMLGTELRLLLEEMVREIAERIVQRRRSDLEAGTVKAPKY